MTKGLGKVILLAALLALLVTMPALGQSPSGAEMADEVSTMFPRSGDTIVLEESPYWDLAGDHAEGWRTFPDMPQIGEQTYNLSIEQNTLNNGQQADFVLWVNNRLVGEFSVYEGDTSKQVTAQFGAIDGPDYKIYLELLNDIVYGELQLPLDVSLLTFGPPVPCVAEEALSRATDAGRLQVLRRFRDEMLADSPAMRERLDAYYVHSPEATSILASHPLLLAPNRELAG